MLIFHERHLPNTKRNKKNALFLGDLEMLKSFPKRVSNTAAHCPKSFVRPVRTTLCECGTSNSPSLHLCAKALILDVKEEKCLEIPQGDAPSSSHSCLLFSTECIGYCSSFATGPTTGPNYHAQDISFLSYIGPCSSKAS